LALEVETPPFWDAASGDVFFSSENSLRWQLPRRIKSRQFSQTICDPWCGPLVMAYYQTENQKLYFARILFSCVPDQR
jgi:hypothetical protein